MYLYFYDSLSAVPVKDHFPLLSSGEVITELESDKDFKYLCILEANDIIHTEMKDKIQKEYYRRMRQLTSWELNDGNTFQAINYRDVNLKERQKN